MTSHPNTQTKQNQTKPNKTNKTDYYYSTQEEGN
jgi:hypothetical protein